MIVNNQNNYYLCMMALHSLRESERFAIDTEATGLRPWGDTQLRGISMAIRGETYYWPVTHPDSVNWPIDNLATNLAKCKAMPILHNANYDRAILERAGILLASHYRDTQILGWLTDENRPKALKKLGEYFFGIDAAEEQKALKILMKGESKTQNYARLRAGGMSVADAKAQSQTTKKTWADLTAEEIANYAEQDARLTSDLYDRLVTDAEYGVVECAVQRLHDLQNVVYRMVRRGAQIDPDMVDRRRSIALSEMAVIAKQFSINLDSPKQIAKLVYEDWGLKIAERTEKGEPSTSRVALEALAGKHTGLDLILAYRRWGKAVSTYYDPFLEAMDGQARIHPSVNCVGTVTGRFSYSDPNLQTIPRDGTISGVKECFVASPGKILVSYDLKAAELRFMASLSGEQALIGALERGDDIYQLTADRIGTTRQIAKSLVLSWPYGVGPVKFSRASGLSVKASREIIAGFESTYVDLASTMSKLSQHADFYGRLPLLSPGRFRRFSSPSLPWPVPGYTALNAACQGGVADFMGDIMIAVEPYAEALGADLVLQVHDSLVFEAVPGTEHVISTELHRLADELNPLTMPLVWTMNSGV